MSQVAPAQLYSYMLAQGIPTAHALGMLNNIKHESAFKPGINEAAPLVPGSRGGYGLFQHTGPRRRALEAYAGKGVSDWRKQLDFALTEPDTKRYLNTDFSDPKQASAWFTEHWERPQHAARKAQQRLHTLNDIISQVGNPTHSAVAQAQAPAQAQPSQGGAQMNPALMKSLLGSMPQEEMFGGIIGDYGRALSGLDRPIMLGKQKIPSLGGELNKQEILRQRKDELQQRRIASVQDRVQGLLGGGNLKPTALEQKLQAAGLQPGTPEYQKAIMDQLTKSDTPLVSVNTGDATVFPDAPEGGNWVKPGDASKGYYTMNPDTGAPNAIKFLPGTKPPSQEAIKYEGQLGLENNIIDGLTKFTADPDAGSALFDLSGKAHEFMQSDTWKAAALRGVIPDGAFEAMGMDMKNPKVAKAMGAIKELQSATLQRISGAAVSEQEAERIKAQLPSIGQSREIFEANLKRTQANLEYLEKLQSQRANVVDPTAPTTGAAPAAPATPMAPSRKDELMKRWGL